MDDGALLQLMRLVSPALPVGAFAYSRGLEQAIASGWVRDERSAAAWIGGLLEHAMGRLDLAVVARLYEAWSGDAEAVLYWSAWLRACRETREILLEEQQMGEALARLLVSLEVEEARPWVGHVDRSFATLFALAARRWGVPKRAALLGYAWAWAETQVGAAVRTVPLGQTAGQRMLSTLMTQVPRVVALAAELEDDALGSLAHGQALASAMHETLYTRLFRS